MNVDSSLLSAETLTRAAIIISVEISLLFSATLSICIFLRNPNLRDVIGSYLVSLATADLLCAILVVPLSAYSALSPKWNFMGDGSILCQSSAYVQLVLLSSTIYTFAWIGVDRYSAFMKPSRYEYEHTLTRCKCWIAFSWITSLLLSCPIIIAKMQVDYHHELELCVLNLSSTTLPYSITLAVLVLLPSALTVLFTSISIGCALRKPSELEDVQRTLMDTDHNFTVTLFIVISFILVWTPIVVICVTQLAFQPNFWNSSDVATMKFAFVWLAIGGSSLKFLVYMFTNAEFRRSIPALCTGKWESVDALNDDPTIRRTGILSALGLSGLCCSTGSARSPSHTNHVREYGSLAQSPALINSY